MDCLEKVYDSDMSYNIVSFGEYEGNKAQNDLRQIISCTGDANSEDYYTPVGYSIGYSTDGTDCGAFGGSEPYVKGGKSGLFVEREGEGGDEPEPEPEPTYPETPIVKGKLDNTATLDIENDVYNSLGEFLKALSIRGINTGTEIEVANQQFDIALDDESYGYIQTSAVALEMAKAYIYMKASNNAIFNIMQAKCRPFWLPLWDSPTISSPRISRFSSTAHSINTPDSRLSRMTCSILRTFTLPSTVRTGQT